MQGSPARAWLGSGATSAGLPEPCGSGLDEEAGRGEKQNVRAAGEHEVLHEHGQCAHVSRTYPRLRTLVRVLALEGDREIEKIYKVAKRGEMHVVSQQKRAGTTNYPQMLPSASLVEARPVQKSSLQRGSEAMLVLR